VGDRDRIRWDDWDSVDDGRRRGDRDNRADLDDGESGRTRRATVTLALAVLAAFLVTIVLCCVAAGQASQLIWLELPPP
jgi:hypothetical protein